MGTGCVYTEGVECELSHPLVYAWMCVYGRGGVCVYREREDMCIWKVWSVCAWGDGGCVYMEGVECVCMGEREDVCIWKGWSVCA